MSTQGKISAAQAPPASRSKSAQRNPFAPDSFYDGQFSDVTVKSGDREWKLHRVVLASKCDFFRVCCGGSFKEAESRLIDMSDDDQQALDLLFRCLYTDDFSFLAQAPGHEMLPDDYLVTLLELLRLADKYNQPELAVYVSKQLLRQHYACHDCTTARQIPCVWLTSRSYHFMSALKWLWDNGDGSSLHQHLHKSFYEMLRDTCTNWTANAVEPWAKPCTSQPAEPGDNRVAELAERMRSICEDPEFLFALASWAMHQNESDNSRNADDIERLECNSAQLADMLEEAEASLQQAETHNNTLATRLIDSQVRRSNENQTAKDEIAALRARLNEAETRLRDIEMRKSRRRDQASGAARRREKVLRRAQASTSDSSDDVSS